jgi:hypothetical protein
VIGEKSFGPGGDAEAVTGDHDSAFMAADGSGARCLPQCTVDEFRVITG